LRSAAYQLGKPSSVVIDLPSTADRGVTHERCSLPSTSTEHEPHWARPQPNRGPRSARSFVSTYRRGVSGADSKVCCRLLTRIRSLLAIASYQNTRLGPMRG